MKTLYYLSFNNYYNRLMKRYETVTEYLSAGAIPCGTSPDVNFFVNDGIYAQHTPYINLLDDIPDYLLVMNEGEIESRWFVTECRYNTGKTQYICSLYRDLIAEFWPQVVDKPFYCEKGWLPISDNGIFNDEAITTSQIKTAEYLIKDNTSIPWIVGYYAAPELNEADKTYTYAETKITPDFTVQNLSDWQYYNLDEQWFADWNLSYYYQYRPLLFGDNEMWHIPFRPGVQGIPEPGTTVRTNWWTRKGESSFAVDVAALSAQGNYPTILPQQLVDLSGISMDDNSRQRVLNLNGKTLYSIAENKYYEIVVKQTTVGRQYVPIYTNTALGQSMISMLGSGGDQIMFDMSGEPNEYNLEYSYSGYRLVVSLVPALLDKGTFTFTRTRRRLRDAPYSMFCIPFTSDEQAWGFIDTENNVFIQPSRTLALEIANAIGAQSGGALYDIQLLPFCPSDFLRKFPPDVTAPDYVPGYPFPVLQDLVDGQDYTVAKDENGTPRAVIFWCETSNGQFTTTTGVPSMFRPENLPNIPSGFKARCQTTFTRLCSPNYNGVFEFSPYKNRGIEYFNVVYSYKPYQPYIKVSPNFGGLYGADYNDGRGLILGGDFSLPTINDQWSTYEVQNKNYQTMFNRQIENMEVQHKYQRRQELANAFTGTLSGGVTGGMAGGMAGGPWGAVAGAAVGTVASAAGGIMDVQAGQALRAEALDYTKDQFGYQLENIKALPNALTRISALNNDNKLFPFLEIYEAPQEELNAVRNKVIYNGMTIERIGKIEDFLISNDWTSPGHYGYIKGKLIRFEGVTEDSHVIEVLANELNKGVFVK